MNRRSFMAAAAASALAPAFIGRASAQTGLPYEAITALRTMGMGPQSQVMNTASYLLDVLGGRLSGSPGIRKSGEWVVSKMKEWGLAGAQLEAWPTDPTGTNNGFPRGWANTKFYLAATSPLSFPISGMSQGWTPGTKGLVAGEVVMVTETTEAQLKSKWAGKLRNKWIMTAPPVQMRAQWDALTKRYTDEQLNAMEVPARPPEQAPATVIPGGATPEDLLRLLQQSGQVPPGTTTFVTPALAPGAAPAVPVAPFNRTAWLISEGALGIFQTNKGHGVVNIMGAANRAADPATVLPVIMIEAEHYGRIARSVMLGQPVTVEADIRNEFFDNPPMFNVVGEIKGTELPNEVVMIGGHFDSFHSATGATDNGGACCVALEAMRLLKATNAPLKRTVRVALWNGEEQGLIGSRLYVASHFGGVRGAPVAGNPRGNVLPITRDHSRFQSYFNLDNGVGSIRGIYTQGNQAIAPIFREWMEPLRDLGVTHVTTRNTGGTDHQSFDAAGLPGFQFIQDPLEYEPTNHHTNMDFYESIQPEDMRRNAVIMASFAMMAANHPKQLPRKARPEPPPAPATTPPRP